MLMIAVLLEYPASTAPVYRVKKALHTANTVDASLLKEKSKQWVRLEITCSPQLTSRKILCAGDLYANSRLMYPANSSPDSF